MNQQSVEQIELRLIAMIDRTRGRQDKRATYETINGINVALDPTDNRFVVGNHTRKDIVSRSINEVAKYLLSKAEVRQIGCGCCTHGCVCWMHQDVPNGLPQRKCDLHKETKQ